MNTVFVWNSYGDSRVYVGDTKEDVINVLKEIAEASQDYEKDVLSVLKLEKLATRIDQIGVEKMRNEINVLVNIIARQSDDDRFDYGSGFFTVEKFGE
jgi:hypothetical protein